MNKCCQSEDGEDEHRVMLDKCIAEGKDAATKPVLSDPFVGVLKL